MIHSTTLRNIAPHVNMICSATMCNDIAMIDTDTMGGRLRWARERAGFPNAAAFARHAGIKPVTYRAYENDQNSVASMAPEIAARLGVPTDWLLRGGPEPEPKSNATVFTEVVPAGLADHHAAKWGAAPLPPIPLLGTAMAGEWDDAGHIEMTELDLGDILDRVRRPQSLAGDDKAYAVTIVGDSMYPRFRPGRRVIVSPRAPVSIGDDVIVQLLGDVDDYGEERVVRVLIKELVRRSSSQVELRQFNPDATFKVPADKVAGIHKVIGEIY